MPEADRSEFLAECEREAQEEWIPTDEMWGYGEDA